MDTRGEVMTESLVLWAVVALAGLVGVTSLGGVMGHAIARDTGEGQGVAARAPSSLVVSQQAVMAGGVGGFLERALVAARDGEASARAVAHLALSSPDAVAASGLHAWGFSRATVRLGLPEYAHEASQALRYGDLRGGGVYLFSPKKLGAEGIDGIFARWDSIGPVDLTRFDSTRTNIAWEWRGVSLKDFSGKEGAPAKILGDVYADLRGNRRHVIEAGYGDLSTLPFESFGGTDVYVSLPQLTTREILTESRRGKIHRYGALTRLIPQPHESRLAFRQIFLEAGDGVVRVRRNRSGALLATEMGDLPAAVNPLVH